MAASGPEVSIDFPEEGEKIDSNVYTFRVGVIPQAALVEVSVDGGPWERCRPSAGYWWFDWVSFEAREYALTARATSTNGTVTASKPRRFKRVAA